MFKGIQKTFNILIAILMTLILFTCSFPVYSMAAESNFNLEEADKDVADNMNGFEQWLWEAAKMVYSTGITDGVEDILKFTITIDEDGNIINPYDGKTSGTDSVKDNIWKTIKTTAEGLQALGSIIVFLYFLIELADKTSHENFNIEHFFRLVIKLVLGLIVIQNSLKILAAALSFGSGMFELIKVQGDGNPGGNEALENVYNELTKNSGFAAFLTQVGMALQLLIPWLIMLGSTIYINVIAYSRLLEIGIMGMLAPIGMADVISEGTHGNGFRYIKRFIALALQGAVILAMLLLYTSINSAISTMGILESKYVTCVVTLAMITLIGKAQTISNSILGV